MLRRLRTEGAKWKQTLEISWSNLMAYKMNFLLLIVGPTIVFFFVKYNVWTSIYAMDGVDDIRGYNLERMLGYQVWVMIVGFLAQGYMGTRLAEDIRLGRISSYLLYPFEFWKFHTAKFLAFQVLEILVAAVTLGATLLLGLVKLPEWEMLAAGALFSLLVGFFWFAVSYAIGLAAFWLEETWVLRVLFMTVSNFLSGAVLPLEIFPRWIRTLLDYTPFPYVTFVPVKIFMGQATGSLWAASANVLLWTLLAGLLAGAIWKRGITLYTAAGM